MIISGSIYNSMKMMKLTMKWQQRQNNPMMPKGDEKEDPEITYLKRSAESVRKGKITATIDSKLRAGVELTSEEMEYLRINHPEMYQEALEIRRERKAYEKQLKACKTKEDVEKLHTQKLQNFTAEIKSIQGNPSLSIAEKRQQMDKVLKKTMGIQNEHTHFINSKEYQELPHEQEVKESKKKEKKHKVENDEPEIDNTSPASKDFYMQLANLFEQEGLQTGSSVSDREGEGKTYSAQGIVTSPNTTVNKNSSSDAKISVKA